MGDFEMEFSSKQSLHLFPNRSKIYFGMFVCENTFFCHCHWGKGREAWSLSLQALSFSPGYDSASGPPRNNRCLGVSLFYCASMAPKTGLPLQNLQESIKTPWLVLGPFLVVD